MGRRAYTRDLYENLLEAFKQAPGNVSRAAITAGCGREMAKIAWEKGFKTKHFELPPIASVLNDLEAEARARLAEEEAERSRKAAEMRAKAREDAIKAAAEEAKGTRYARQTNAVELLVLGKLLEASEPVIKRLVAEFAVMADVQKTPKLNLTKTLKLFQQMAYVVDRATRGHMIAMQQERLRVGQPMAILGVSAEQMQPEAGPMEFGDIERTLARARELGLIPPAVPGEEADKKVH